MENKFIVRTTLDAAACKALARHQTRRLKSLFLGIDILLAVCTALLWRSGSSFAGLASVVLLLLVFLINLGTKSLAANFDVTRKK